MSKDWVLRTVDKLINKMDAPTYRTFHRLISHDQYRARLFRMKPVGKESIQISIYKIKNKSLKAFDKVRDSQLRPININAPESSFEIGIVKAYNDCRRKYLRKYMDGLSDGEIDVLLRDNYLHERDVKKLLHY